jgi:acyl-CoA thioester hydrolase
LRLEDFPHKAIDIIRLGDLDHQNHVNNAVFATYFETGRVNFMRDVFGGLRFGERNFVVARLEINYLRELHWPGMVDVCTGVERIGSSSVTYAQAAFHAGECAASGRTTMVLIDRATRRSSPLTEDILNLLRANQMR